MLQRAERHPRLEAPDRNVLSMGAPGLGSEPLLAIHLRQGVRGAVRRGLWVWVVEPAFADARSRKGGGGMGAPESLWRDEPRQCAMTGVYVEVSAPNPRPVEYVRADSLAAAQARIA